MTVMLSESENDKDAGSVLSVAYKNDIATAWAI